MNETIGLADAKARLSELIDRVEAGETVIIARNGLLVAEVRPVRHVSPEDAVKKIRAIAKRVSKRNLGKAEPFVMSRMMGIGSDVSLVLDVSVAAKWSCVMNRTLALLRC